jgi:hypothetical protein
VPTLFQAARSADPAYHALVIGVSQYRHLAGGRGPLSDDPLAQGLGQLSAAATSAARVALWIRDHFDPPTAGKGSIRLLVSPSPGEVLPDHISAPPATTDEVSTALFEWRRDVRADEDNVALLYVAGHGIQTSMEGGILLLEDFGRPFALTPLAGAVDIESVRRGIVSDPNLPDTHTPKLQFYFYDACRVIPPATENYFVLNAGITLEVPRTKRLPKASLVSFGARSQSSAFADPKLRSTLFSRALLDCLNSRAQVHTDGRTVRYSELQPALEESVLELADFYDEDQEATFGGGGSSTVAVHRRPDRGVFGTDMEARAQGTRSVRFDIHPSLPVLARAADVVIGEPGNGDDGIDMPIGRGFEAVVPLPWGGEYIEHFDVEPGDGEVHVPVHVPLGRLESPPSRRTRRFRAASLDVATISQGIRFLQWDGIGFVPHVSPPYMSNPRPAELGEVTIKVALSDKSFRAMEGLSYINDDNFEEIHPDPTSVFFQIESGYGESSIVALPLGTGSGRECEVTIHSKRGQLAVSARPNFGRTSVVAGYLHTGRADRALVAMGDDAAELLRGKIEDPIGAAIGGYALLKLNRLDRMHDWPENLARWFRWLPDGAVIAGAVAARRGERNMALRWFERASRRGIPIFSEGLSLLSTDIRALVRGPGTRRADFDLGDRDPSWDDRDGLPPDWRARRGRLAAAGAVARVANLSLSADQSALCTTLRFDRRIR